MSVIAFPNLAPQGPEASMSWELRSLTAINRSPLNAVVTTLERPGAHWAVRMPYQNLAESRRARLQSFVSSARGHAQRFYVPVYGWTRRGSFPATELLTNGDFASSTTGWTAATSSISAADGVLRVTATLSGFQPSVFQSVALTQYAPHALRSVLIDGRGTTGLNIGREINGGFVTNDPGTSRGLGTVVLVPLDGAAHDQYPGFMSSTTGYTAGAYYSIGYASLARCALVDNAPNLLLQSDDLTTSWTNVRSTDAANSTAAPDGTTTADSLIEDATASNTHYIEQNVTVASAVADYVFSVAIKESSLAWANIAIGEGTGSSECSAYVNLNTGAVGTIATGANWSNVRVFSSSLGGGWFQFCIVGRKTNAATTLTARIYTAAADGVASYNGDGTSHIFVWRATLAQSSVPTRLVQTTSTASSGTSQTGSALYLKGLPASTSGLLLKGDPVEIITGSTSQLVRTREPLNSDAAGLGHFEFEPPLRISPSDNAAVIIQNPMCRMMMENNVNGWTDRLGGFSDLEFAAVEDVSP